MTAAAKHLTPVTLELGGKNPCYVSDNCDVKNVARRVAWGRFFNAGQTCIAPNYILCSVEMQNKLVPALREAITMFYGPNPQESPDFARIMGDKQFRRVRALLKSGRVAIGGQTDEKERYIGEGLHFGYVFSTLHRVDVGFGEGLATRGELEGIFREGLHGSWARHPALEEEPALCAGQVVSSSLVHG